MTDVVSDQARRSGIVQQVGKAEQGDRQHHRQIAVLRQHDLPQDKRGEGEVEAAIDQRQQGERQLGRGEGQGAGEEPPQRQRGQRRARDRQAAGPVGHGGQRETGYGCANKAEQHFVAMPGQRIERADLRHADTESPQPDRDGDDGPNARAQKERPKAAAQHRRGLFHPAAAQFEPVAIVERSSHHLSSSRKSTRPVSRW